MKDRKILIVISAIFFIRILMSIFISDVLYPNTNNLIEAMLLDLSPFLIMGMGLLIYELIIRKYDIIVSKYTDEPILPTLVIPIFFIMIIFMLYNKNLILDSYDDNLAINVFLYLPSWVKGLDNVFNWLKDKTFLGYNAYIFATTSFIVIAAIIMILSLMYLFYLMYKIVKSPKKISSYSEKIFIIICTYLLVTINITTINLYLLYFDKNAFSDFTLSSNSFEALLDSVYFTIKNFIAIGGNEANSSLAKIIVICTTCINIYFFIIFVQMLLSKTEIKIISNVEEGQMITTCKFNYDRSERYFMNKIWNESNRRAVFIGINPSYANGIKGDNTTTNVINYLVDNGYGSLSVLNLFYIVDVTTKLNNSSYATDFNDYKEILEKSHVIIIGWGTDKKKYIPQKKKAESVLRMYSEKVYTFSDKNKQAVHPRKITDTTTLAKYRFIYSTDEKRD